MPGVLAVPPGVPAGVPAEPEELAAAERAGSVALRAEQVDSRWAEPAEDPLLEGPAQAEPPVVYCSGGAKRGR